MNLHLLVLKDTDSDLNASSGPLPLVLQILLAAAYQKIVSRHHAQVAVRPFSILYVLGEGVFPSALHCIKSARTKRYLVHDFRGLNVKQA